MEDEKRDASEEPIDTHRELTADIEPEAMAVVDAAAADVKATIDGGRSMEEIKAAVDWVRGWLMGILATWQDYDRLHAFFADCIQDENSWAGGRNKALLLLGPGRNGKTTIVHTLAALLGSEMLSYRADLGSQFGLEGLLDKRLNVISDFPAWPRLSSRAANFKRIMAGEPVTMERKYAEPVNESLRINFIATTNEIPEDLSESAMIKRFDIVHCGQEIVNPDPEFFKNEILPNLARIRTWAATILSRGSSDISKCVNCGKPGSHFVPPSLGEDGFFICE